MKIICVGRNYAAHAAELGNKIPEAPVLFLKPKTALLLPDKDLYYPEFTKDLHYECELVIKISSNGKHIGERFAHKYFNEISVGLDFTARDVQQQQKEKGLPWEIAKAFDGSAAVGKFQPVAPDKNLTEVAFHLLQNGNEVQREFSGEMLFSIPQIIAYASRYFTLNIGDLIFTGTPPGVGPVQINDKLECFLNNEKLLEVNIR